MPAGEAALAVGVFVVFAAVGLAMARSARSDWAEGRAADDPVTMASAVGQWWPALLAFLLAVGVPVAIALSG